MIVTFLNSGSENQSYRYEGIQNRFFPHASWVLLVDNKVIVCGVLCNTFLYFLFTCSGTFWIFDLYMWFVLVWQVHCWCYIKYYWSLWLSVWDEQRDSFIQAHLLKWHSFVSGLKFVMFKILTKQVFNNITRKFVLWTSLKSHSSLLITFEAFDICIFNNLLLFFFIFTLTLTVSTSLVLYLYVDIWKIKWMNEWMNEWMNLNEWNFSSVLNENRPKHLPSTVLWWVDCL